MFKKFKTALNHSHNRDTIFTPFKHFTQYSSLNDDPENEINAHSFSQRAKLTLSEMEKQSRNERKMNVAKVM